MKKVTWGAPVIQSNFLGGQKPKTFQDLWKAGQDLEREQQAANAFLAKAMPAMLALLEYKLKHGEPLVVMRPLRYQTSEIEGSQEDDIDKAFYNQRQEEKPKKFVDAVKTILPGTQLMLKSLDMALNEFVFTDAMGNEHALNFAERNNLLTQTNIFEEVQKFFEAKGE